MALTAHAAGPDPPAPVLRLRGIGRSYPGVRALGGIDLDVAAGEVRALVGENGAGKSTLLRIISGVIEPDEGAMEVAGRPVSGLTPRAARALGIQLVAQERQIAPHLSVTENVLLGRLPRRRGVVDWRVAHRVARERLERVGLQLDPRTLARDLGVAQMQAVEIARALSADARVIVLDEPTATLGADEIARLFANLRGLRESGVAVLYVSHHLEEIFAIADTVTVLRDGAHVLTAPRHELDTARLIELMLGRSPESVARTAPTATRELARRPAALQAVNLRCGLLRDVTFALREGEILAVAGAVGSGRRELARCVVGLMAPEAGTLTLGDGAPGPASPREALRRGVVFLPEDRKREGLMLDLGLVDNIGVGRLALERSPLARPGPRRAEAAERCQDLRIRARGLHDPVRALSGGNQQKAMLGRWLTVGARLFVFDEPTAGVDVGTKLELYALLRRLTAEGAALLVFSSDFEEIKLLAHRVLVLSRGIIADELVGEDITEDRMLSTLVGAA